MKNTEKRLYELFRCLSIQPSTKGYEYAKEAILMKINAEEKGKIIKIGEIYNHIADSRGVSFSSVERAIRYIKQKSISNVNVRPMVLKIFGNVSATGFTNSDFICCICEYLKYNEGKVIKIIDTEKGEV